jgi:hypothetical protein
VFDKDKIGKDTSLGRVEVNLADLKGVKGKWLPLQVNSNFVRTAIPELKVYYMLQFCYFWTYHVRLILYD